ncbi:MAG: hypothetical protein Q7R40_00035 [Phaeospirillum sp.]|nr:hypothetical protein [Phaeospirillum sp.]
MPQIGFRISDELAALIDARAASLGTERQDALRTDLHELYGALALAPGSIAESVRAHRQGVYGLVMQADRILTFGRRALRDRLSPAEVALVADHATGTWYDESTTPWLAFGVSESIRLDGLAEKWDVDGPALVAKLGALDYGACWALVDACQRFWARVKGGEQLDPRRLLEESQ